MRESNVLKATRQKIFDKDFFGFDIETYDENRKFLLASIVGVTRSGEYVERVYYKPEDVVRDLKTDRLFKDSVLFATNLAFDFFGTFFNSDDKSKFHTVFRGSDLLFTKTYYSGDGGFTAQRYYGKTRKERPSLTFIDSLNYAKMSVKKMGSVIGVEKLEPPEWIGQYPRDRDQWAEMTRYNIRDSLVTYKFMEFLIESFEHLGATFKYTIASTSMSLFKNKYLGDYEVVQPSKDVLLEVFEAYYGGRTESFKRGSFENVNYYDFNSLYPSVMHDYEFPDPNSMRTVRNVTSHYIQEYEGVSRVRVRVPESFAPPLPYRMEDGKVVFPCGELEGWYSHVELRHAVKHGCTIDRVDKSIYYTRTVRPFKKFVSDMYNLRLEYKKRGSPLQLVTKLFMNSLYGKFGEKFLDKRNTVHESVMTLDKLQGLEKVERVGEYFTFSSDTEPKSHCVPIWAVYVTAYGRIKMHEVLVAHDPIYCDTDSIITSDTIAESDRLGDLKLEMRVDKGITVRPKFYALRNDGECTVKIKGVAKRLLWSEFFDVISHPRVVYSKFAKFKESLRRGFIPNQVIETHKELSLEDTKRDWRGRRFDPETLQESRPLCIVDPSFSVADSERERDQEPAYQDR